MEWSLKECNGFSREMNGIESFYNNITIIFLILKNIKNNQWELIIALKCLVFGGWCETS